MKSTKTQHSRRYPPLYMSLRHQVFKLEDILDIHPFPRRKHTIKYAVEYEICFGKES